MAMRRQLLSLRRTLGAVAEQSAAAEASTSGRQLPTTTRELRLFFSSSAKLLSTPISETSRAAAAATTATARKGGLRSLLRDYKQLSKFRLSALVVSTAAAGYVAGSDEKIDWAGLGWTSLGTMLAASSANALNQVYEVVNDGRMRRTATRPLPTGRMSRAHAVAFAVIAGVGGVVLLADKTNMTTAALGAANIILYAGVYTPLKQISVINTWVGAVVGAVPPLMGWAAAAGKLDVGSLLLASGLYFWQMPHFMALAWLCRADYAAGGYRMLSLVDPTGKRTAACALRNCAYLFPLGMLATWLDVTTPYFAYESAFITAGMLLTAAKFYSAPSNSNARLLFRASLLHLPIFMIAFLLHRKPNTGQDRAELLVYNARLLGFGASLEPGEHRGASAAAAIMDAQHGGSGGAQGQSEFSQAMGRVSLPPLPFLPAPHQLAMQCPSKAMCDEEAEAEGGEEKRKE